VTKDWKNFARIWINVFFSVTASGIFSFQSLWYFILFLWGTICFLLCDPRSDYQQCEPNVNRWLSVRVWCWILLMYFIVGYTSFFRWLVVILLVDFEILQFVFSSNVCDRAWILTICVEKRHILLFTVEIAVLTWIVYGHVAILTYLRLRRLQRAGHILRIDDSRLSKWVIGGSFGG
jgi:hypothetical protein